MAAPQEVFLGFGAQERHSRKIVFHCIIVIVIIITITNTTAVAIA